MPEIKESSFNRKKVLYLLSIIDSYGVSKYELPSVLETLVSAVIAEVDKTGDIPDYAYILRLCSSEIFSDPIDGNYLEIVCGFEIKKENIEDIAIEESFLFPRFANVRMNLDSKKVDNVNIDWEKHNLRDYDTFHL